MQEKATPAMSDLYGAYASGTLDAGFRLMLDAQSQLRLDIGQDVELSEAVSGLFLDEEQGEPLSEGAWDDTLKAVEALPPVEAAREGALAASRALNELLALPDVILDPALSAIETDGWSRVTSGIQRLALDVGSEAEVELYRLEPNTVVPRHSHESSELTLVLTGSFSDESGTFRPGDVAVKGAEDTHQPIAEDDGVCYTLAVRDGRLKFKGLRGLLQQFVGR